MSLLDKLGFAAPVVETRPTAGADGMLIIPTAWRINTPEDARRELVRAQYAPLREVSALLRRQAG